MANIIPFDSNARLPAYLKKVDVAALNADLTSHAGGGFPVVSIKGKRFTVVRDGEKTVLMNPLDPDSPASSMEVVLLKANKGTSKVFYPKGYDPETSEGQKPDCYSPDGIAPAADSQNPQAKKCATCPHNQWGSRVTEKGASKGKACNDTVRLAIAPAGQLNDPMLLRVPPASIRNLGEYGQLLAKRGVGYNMVVTKVSFDLEAESPKLVFRPVGFLDDEAFAEVQETLEDDVVRDILGNVVAGIEAAAANSGEAVDPETGEITPEPAKPAAKAAKPATKVTDEEVIEAVRAAEKPAAKPAAKAAKPAAKPAPAVVEDDVDFDLDGISFDD